MSPPSVPPAPVPLSFSHDGHWSFGWYHAPAAPWRALAVVLCPPIGHEAVCSHPTYVQLARALAAGGFPVLRFDYAGTGDSGGDDHEPDRVEAWIGSVEAAVAQARRCAGTEAVTLFGLRLGATLALEAATRLGGVDSLLLWAPCATGKTFVRELRAAASASGPAGLLAMGTHYGAETLQDLLALDPVQGGPAPAAPPARRALVVGRDDLPAEGPLPRALARRGVDTQHRVLPGYAAMVGEPREGALSPSTLDVLLDWLADSPHAEPQALPPPRWERAPATRWTAGVRETPVRLGPAGQLFGILAEPRQAAGLERAGQTAVVLLNVGGNHRVGPHRFYVHAARALAQHGYRVLRLDLPGIGDSPPAPGKLWGTLYDRDAVQDVRSALDALGLQGCREFVLMGICAGSYVAFQSALADARVDGVVLMNSRLLEWTPGDDPDGWQTAMQQYVKSTDHYWRALLRPQVWTRLLRGQVHVRPIARRFSALAWAHVRRWWSFGAETGESLTARMRRLCRRGTDVLMLVSDADDGRDYVEFHFGKHGRRMQGLPGYRMAYVPEADHTFSRPGNQAFVIGELVSHLQQRPAPRRAAAAERPATWTGAARHGG
jgi:alpha-beta hydrolase superfamily lysophospholipase